MKAKEKVLEILEDQIKVFKKIVALSGLCTVLSIVFLLIWAPETISSLLVLWTMLFFLEYGVLIGIQFSVKKLREG